MENKQKIIVFTVVALLVGAAIGAAIGVAVKSSDKSCDDSETYNFYLYFGDDDAKNGWYSASASDAGAAFEKAMKNADISYEINKYGYLSSINGNNGNGAGWYLAQYVYKDTTKAAADGSIGGASKSYGSLVSSNGWKALSGYDDESYSFKLSELNSTIYFLSPYKADWSAVGPTDVTSWMTTGPFKA